MILKVCFSRLFKNFQTLEPLKKLFPVQNMQKNCFWKKINQIIINKQNILKIKKNANEIIL